MASGQISLLRLWPVRGFYCTTHAVAVVSLYLAQIVQPLVFVFGMG
jgi:hypothetical protein